MRPKVLYVVVYTSQVSSWNMSSVEGFRHEMRARLLRACCYWPALTGCFNSCCCRWVIGQSPLTRLIWVSASPQDIYYCLVHQASAVQPQHMLAHVTPAGGCSVVATLSRRRVSPRLLCTRDLAVWIRQASCSLLRRCRAHQRLLLLSLLWDSDSRRTHHAPVKLGSVRTWRVLVVSCRHGTVKIFCASTLCTTLRWWSAGGGKQRWGVTEGAYHDILLPYLRPLSLVFSFFFLFLSSFLSSSGLACWFATFRLRILCVWHCMAYEPYCILRCVSLIFSLWPQSSFF